MDQALVDSIRKSLEAKSTDELRQAHGAGGKSPEELEAMRQILDERRWKGNRAMLALVSAVLIGSLAAFGIWWQLGPGIEAFLAGVGGAVLGFGSWYIRDLIPRV